ncbi:hypothetical protein SAMN05660649_05192 [Desulfotomaculum arcticum]|uniref:Transglutaminase-like superfamily protein n=1 Tax=Desulfotruncus arcticus DSM 17038 TaxID=1121424 RepID=A0A1I3A0Q9_9FIRM|nr:hypothetical protein [Desulfotruncus arcticus]SFH43663.1 hypothetical protein SAMN05660649_05192 [Desulfotomaculum arcticum] [Desulfotruncus arcticus DSM 17038]
MNKLVVLKYKKIIVFLIFSLLFLAKPAFAASSNTAIFTVGSTKYTNSNFLNLTSSLEITTQNVPSFTYPESAKITNRDYQWQYNNITYKWHLEIPNDLLDWDREVYDLIDKFYHSNGHTQHNILSSVPNSLKEIILSTTLISNSNHTPFINEQNNSLYVKRLADSLSEQANFNNYDYFHTAEFAQSFVGGAIPYMKSDLPKLPVQTLVDNGDCTDKSILLATILKNMGYNVALLFFPNEDNQDGHLAVGIEFSDPQIPTNRDLIYYLHDGVKYYFTETTEPGWKIGEDSDEALDEGFVYPVN